MGENFGRYTRLERIGTGGFSVVYRAWDPNVGRLVALKILDRSKAEQPKVHELFVNEGQALGRLGKHHNLVQVYDAGKEGDIPFIVMELIEGTNLREQVEYNGSFSKEVVVDVAFQIAKALTVIHDKGLLHLDIKPANIVSTRDSSGSDLYVLLDLGISNRDGVTVDDSKTLGTPNFMAYEQLIRGGRVSKRTDIYQFAATIYYLLTGKPPFSTLPGEKIHDVVNKVIYGHPEDLHTTLPNLPKGMAKLVMKALAKEPEERPADASTFAAELKQAADYHYEPTQHFTPSTVTGPAPTISVQPARDPGASPESSLPSVPPLAPRSRRWLWVMGGGVVAIVIAGVIAVVWPRYEQALTGDVSPGSGAGSAAATLPIGECDRLTGTFEGTAVRATLVRPCTGAEPLIHNDQVRVRFDHIPQGARVYAFMKPGNPSQGSEFRAGSLATREGDDIWRSEVIVGEDGEDDRGKEFSTCVVITTKVYTPGQVINSMPESPGQDFGECVTSVRE